LALRYASRLPVKAVGIRGWSSSTYTDEAGDYRAAVAVCPECDEAFEFEGEG
jgi:hypothetical protein